MSLGALDEMGCLEHVEMRNSHNKAGCPFSALSIKLYQVSHGFAKK